MKVLLLAYACEPGRGSEPGVGWHWAHNLAPHAEIHVLTRANNKEVISEAMSLSAAKIIFHYHDLGSYTSSIKRLIGVQAYHQLWHLSALRIIARLQKAHDFDLIHHLTFGVVWGVSPAWIVARRFVWGPFGGGDTSPAVITRTWPLRPRLSEAVRRYLVRLAFRLNPLAWLSFSRANLLLARTQSTYDAIPVRFLHKAKVLLETGAPVVPQAPDEARIIAKSEEISRELKLLTIGRLIPYKNTELTLHALALLCKRGCRPKLNIIGGGPELAKLSALSISLDIAEQVTFRGQLTRDEVFEELSQAHLLIHPAVRDGGTWSIFEALAMGLPVICVDNAGPGAIVAGDSGVKLAPDKPELMAEAMANAIVTLTIDAATWVHHSRAARSRASAELSWEAITATILAQWRQVIADQG